MKAPCWGLVRKGWSCWRKASPYSATRAGRLLRKIAFSCQPSYFELKRKSGVSTKPAMCELTRHKCSAPGCASAHDAADAPKWAKVMFCMRAMLRISEAYEGPGCEMPLSSRKRPPMATARTRAFGASAANLWAIRSLCKKTAKPPADCPTKTSSVASPKPFASMKSTAASKFRRPRKYNSDPSRPGTGQGSGRAPEKEAPSP
mmetsp:Transcript_119663/g.343741  ORF Transcript_119663/g.343741 Transcript_119663/m.343741 type:complete len:203 (-) Transcript_119663:259-867(-)